MAIPNYPTNPPRSFVGYIYSITNKANGKQYIGQTTGTVGRRWQAHCSAARGEAREPIACAIRKYGEDSFTVIQVLQANSQDQLDEEESVHIRDYGTLAPKGYNLESGGRAKFTEHPDTKRHRLEKLSRMRPPQSMTPSEVAAYLRVSKETVLRLLRSGQLCGEKIGRSWAISRIVLQQKFMTGGNNDRHQ